MQKKAIPAKFLLGGGALLGGVIGKHLYDNITEEPDPIQNLWGQQVPFNAKNQGRRRRMGLPYREGRTMYHGANEISPTRRLWESLSPQARASMDIQHVFDKDDYSETDQAIKGINPSIPPRLQKMKDYRDTVKRIGLQKKYLKAKENEEGYDSVKKWGVTL